MLLTAMSFYNFANNLAKKNDDDIQFLNKNTKSKLCHNQYILLPLLPNVHKYFPNSDILMALFLMMNLISGSAIIVWSSFYLKIMHVYQMSMAL